MFWASSIFFFIFIFSKFPILAVWFCFVILLFCFHKSESIESSHNECIAMNAIDSSNQLIPLSFESFSAKIISNKHHFVFEAFEHDSRKLKRSIIERKRSFQMKLPSESDAIESILECERKLFFHTNTKGRYSIDFKQT